MALTDNLISYWKLDESSGNATDSIGGNTLTNTGVVYSTGKINNGADFERTDATDILTIADASQSGLDITGDIALSVWAKVETAPGDTEQYYFANKFLGTGNQRSYSFFYRNVGGTMSLAFNAGSGVDSELLSKNSDLGTGVWHHIVYSWKATTSTLTVYVDGTSIGTVVGTYTSLFNGTSNFSIGDSQPSAGNIFDGMLDEIGIWSRELTASEITSLYNGGAGNQYPFSIDISVFDTLTISEEVTKVLISSINKSDDLTIAESVTLTLANDINVSDALTITESVTLTLANNINVSDALAITESVTLSNSQLGGINVSDALAITESVTLSNSQLGGINVSDALTITESVTLTLANNINVSDALAITEINTLELISYINVIEAELIVEESIVQNNQLGSIDIFDTLVITENLTIQNSQLGDINLNEALLITENYTLINSQLGGINVNETPTITESITLFETEEGGNPNVSDTLSITESITVSVPELGDISKSENLTISENMTVFETEEGGNPNVSDVLTISESITLENFRFSPSRTVPVGSVRVFSPYGR